MDQLNKQSYDDKLRTRFTSWLTTLLRRARIDYVRQQKEEVMFISIEDVDEDQYAVEDRYINLQSEFEFEEKRLAEAFFSLPIRRQRILTMLFAEEKKPAEIAEELHCSTEFVARQRYLALKRLRKLLEEEDAK